MLTLSLILFLLSTSITSRKDKSILYYRPTITILLITLIITQDNLMLTHIEWFELTLSLIYHYWDFILIFSVLISLCLCNFIFRVRAYSNSYLYKLKRIFVSSGFTPAILWLVIVIKYKIKKFLFYMYKNKKNIMKFIFAVYAFNILFNIFLLINGVSTPLFQVDPYKSSVIFFYRITCLNFIIILFKKSSSPISWMELITSSFSFMSMISIYIYFIIYNIYILPFIAEEVLNIFKLGFIGISSILYVMEHIINPKYKPISSIISQLELHTKYLSPSIYTNIGGRFTYLSLHRKINNLVSYRINVPASFKFIPSITPVSIEMPITYFATKYGYDELVKIINYYNKELKKNVITTGHSSFDTIDTTLINNVNYIYNKSKLALENINNSQHKVNESPSYLKNISIKENYDSNYYYSYVVKLINRLNALDEYKRVIPDEEKNITVLMNNNIYYNDYIDTGIEDQSINTNINNTTTFVNNYDLLEFNSHIQQTENQNYTHLLDEHWHFNTGYTSNSNEVEYVDDSKDIDVNEPQNTGLVGNSNVSENNVADNILNLNPMELAGEFVIRSEHCVNDSFLGKNLFDICVNLIALSKNPSIDELGYDSQETKQSFILEVRNRLLGADIPNIDNSTLRLKRLANFIPRVLPGRVTSKPRYEDSNLPWDSVYPVCNLNRITAEDTLNSMENIRQVRDKLWNMIFSDSTPSVPTFHYVAFDKLSTKERFTGIVKRLSGNYYRSYRVINDYMFELTKVLEGRT